MPAGAPFLDRGTTPYEKGLDPHPRDPIPSGILLAERPRRRRRGQALSDQVSDFEGEILRWVERHASLAKDNLIHALDALVTASTLILAQPSRELKEEIGTLLLNLIPLPRAVTIARRLVLFTISQITSGEIQAEARGKLNFIVDIQVWLRRVADEEILQREIRRVGGGWLRELAAVQDKRAEMERIQRLMADVPEAELVCRQRFLAEIMKKYWDYAAPVARFEIRASQPWESIMPVAPVAIHNWREVIDAIKPRAFQRRTDCIGSEGDQSWTSILGRPIEVNWGGTIHTFSTTTSGRSQLETFLLAHRRLLEDQR